MEVLRPRIAALGGAPGPGASARRRARVKRLTTALVLGSVAFNYGAAVGWLVSGDGWFLSLLAPSMSGLALVAALDVGVWLYYDGRRRWSRRPQMRTVAEPRYVAPVVYGLVYAWFESGYVGNLVDTSSLEYRIFYLAAMALPFYTKNLPLWVADALLAVTAEDVGFWAFRFWLPDQWAWYYPTVLHVPLLDVAAAAVIPLLYWWALARGKGRQAKAALAQVPGTGSRRAAIRPASRTRPARTLAAGTA